MTRLEFGHKLRKIVNLAVKNDANVAVLIVDRLVAAREIDN